MGGYLVLAAALGSVLPTSAAAAETGGQAGKSAAPPTTEEVLRLFARRCVECHGPAKQSGRLRLDTLEGVFRGGRNGPAVAAGKSAQSLLYQKLLPGAEKRMPPKGEPLGDEEIEAVRAWIDSGARAAATVVLPSPAPAVLEPLPPGFRPVLCLAGDPTGPRIAVGRGAVVEVHSVPDSEKEPVARLALLEGHRDVVQSLAYSPDGQLLASGEFQTVRVWSTADWKLKQTWEGHAHRVLALAFRPDSRRLAAGGGLPAQSGEVRLWDLESGAPLWSAAPHSDTVLGLDFSPDGRTIITAAADRTTRLLEGESGKDLRRLEGHTHHVLAVAMDPEGKRAATAGGDGVVRLWELEGGDRRSLRGHEAPVTSVEFVREGKTVISTGGDGTVRLWNASGRGGEESLGGGKAGYLQAGAAFAAGKRYAAADEDGRVRIYDLEKKRLLRTLDPPPAQ